MVNLPMVDRVVAKLHGLKMAVILTTYKSWDDLPSSRAKTTGQNVRLPQSRSPSAPVVGSSFTLIPTRIPTKVWMPNCRPLSLEM